MYKTIILKGDIEVVQNELKKKIPLLSLDGSIFCYVQNEYDNNNRIQKDFMDVIAYGIQNHLVYQNTIIVPKEIEKSPDHIQYLVWFVKSADQMYFDKDQIREKHIWKDVEWGKRQKNYNPKGKDPGNVWIPTLDDGKANITSHICLTRTEIYDRILKATVISTDCIFLMSDCFTDATYQFQNNRIDYQYFESKSSSSSDFTYEDQKQSIKESFGTIIFDTSEHMIEVKDESIALIVTSPPYWDLKDYFKENQIGQESYEIYSERMNLVFQNCYHKLAQTGSLWININIRNRKGNPILLPKLFIHQCKAIGFNYKGILIWHKSSGIPTHAKNLGDHHEYVLIFTKSNTCKIQSFLKHPYSDYKNPALNGGFLWNINRKAGSVGKKMIHPAIYPTELTNRIISLASEVGDIIMDPFLGSGTTLISACNYHRNFCGYEYNEGFKELILARIDEEIHQKYHIKLIEKNQKKSIEKV